MTGIIEGIKEHGWKAALVGAVGFIGYGIYHDTKEKYRLLKNERPPKRRPTSQVTSAIAESVVDVPIERGPAI